MPDQLLEYVSFPLRPQSLNQYGDENVQVLDHAQMGHVENVRVAVGVNRHDQLRAAHARGVLERAGNSAGNVKQGPRKAVPCRAANANIMPRGFARAITRPPAANKWKRKLNK